MGPRIRTRPQRPRRVVLDDLRRHSSRQGLAAHTPILLMERLGCTSNPAGALRLTSPSRGSDSRDSHGGRGTRPKRRGGREPDRGAVSRTFLVSQLGVLSPAPPGALCGLPAQRSACRWDAQGAKTRAREVTPEADLPHAGALGRPGRDVRRTSLDRCSTVGRLLALDRVSISRLRRVH